MIKKVEFVDINLLYSNSSLNISGFGIVIDKSYFTFKLAAAPRATVKSLMPGCPLYEGPTIPKVSFSNCDLLLLQIGAIFKSFTGVSLFCFTLILINLWLISDATFGLLYIISFSLKTAYTSINGVSSDNFRDDEDTFVRLIRNYLQLFPSSDLISFYLV